MNDAATISPPRPVRLGEPASGSPGAQGEAGPRPVRRLPVVDALRAIAALSVMLHHMPEFSGPLIVLKPLQAIGFIGVGMFLVLSGFSIHYKWAAQRSGGRFDQRVFWRRRFFRLYPSYIIAAAIAVAVAAATGALLQPAAPWGSGDELVPWSWAWFSQAVAVTANVIPVPALWVTWTIALEFQLYAAYSLVVRFVHRFDPVKIVLVALAVTLAWRVGAQQVITSVPAGLFLPDGSSPLESRILFGQMPARCFEWFLGMLAAEAYFGNVKLPRFTRSALLACALMPLIGFMQRFPQIPLEFGNPFMLTDIFFDPVVGFTFFVLLNWAISERAGWLERVGGGRPLAVAAYVGLFSYSIYLIHDTVIKLWEHIFGSTSQLLLLPLAAIAIGASWLFFMAVERHYLYKR